MTKTTVSADQVREYIVHLFAEQLIQAGYGPSNVPDDFDLLTNGIIDSLGILNLVASLDTRFGMNIDFENIDAEHMTQIGPLSRYVEGVSGSLRQ